jgi:hypothetical protein
MIKPLVFFKHIQSAYNGIPYFHRTGCIQRERPDFGDVLKIGKRF